MIDTSVIKKINIYFQIIIATLVIFSGLTVTSVRAIEQNVVTNSSFEQGDAGSAPGWTKNWWGRMNAAFSIKSGSAQDGNRSARVDVTGYSRGDARWATTEILVVPNQTYTLSNWYKSNVTTSLDVAVITSSGTVRYHWLKDAPAAASWTQLSANFKTPKNAKKIIVYHLIAANGWLETDNYSVSTSAPAPTPTPLPTPSPTPPPPAPTPPAPTPTPTPTPPPPTSGRFSRPLVSIEFDDGWGTAYRLGLPLVESFGWKPTQYIIADTVANNALYGAGTYMTSAEVKDWNNRGDIGSHSVTHPSVPSLSSAKRLAELTNSKNYLDSLLGEPTKLYASPYCESSAAVVTVAQTLYQDVRNCIAEPNTAVNFNRWDVRSFIVLNTTSDSELRTILNQTKASNGWLVLVWHEIDGDRKNAWSVSAETLKRQLQIVKDSGIAVVTSQQGLNESL